MNDIDNKIEELIKEYKAPKSQKFYIALLIIMSTVALALATAIIVLLTFR